MPYTNYMEHAVVDELKDILNQIDICKCERCQEDMVAWTLNRLPARYVVTDIGKAYTKLNQLKAQSKTDITVMLMGAAEVVRAKPRH